MADQLIIFGSAYLFLFIPALGLLFFATQPRSVQKRMLLFGGMLLPTAYLVGRLLQRFYYNPRPFVQNDVVPLIPHAPDNGFPSDHTLFAAAIAAAVFPFNKKLGTALALITAVSGASRVLAGVHHGIDVLGSMVIAAFAGLMIYYAIKRYGKARL
ncbi:MAG: phosphatase PAP2 family protein [Parcubacteria group bacterium]|nr:phosphatase PAP2 family protein [Parcubacteria group bacterium]